MSTPTSPPPHAAVAPPPGVTPVVMMPREIRIYGHSTLLYWWPVWAVGYVLAFMTYAHDSRLAILPPTAKYDPQEQKITVPKGDLKSHPDLPERVHEAKGLGVVFSFVLLLVILITNVPLRGLASAVVTVTVLFFVVLFLWLGWWDDILDALGRLSIHMNMGFYVFFSTALLIVWALVIFGVDRMHYWRITPGQITQEFVFGGGERSFDTEGMAFEKLRSDPFRHWVLGLGSGDLIMHPLKAVAGEDMNIQNVLFLNRKLRQIQELISGEGKTVTA